MWRGAEGVRPVGPVLAAGPGGRRSRVRVSAGPVRDLPTAGGRASTFLAALLLVLARPDSRGTVPPHQAVGAQPPCLAEPSHGFIFPRMGPLQADVCVCMCVCARVWCGGFQITHRWALWKCMQMKGANQPQSFCICSLDLPRWALPSLAGSRPRAGGRPLPAPPRQVPPPCSSLTPVHTRTPCHTLLTLT